MSSPTSSEASTNPPSTGEIGLSRSKYGSGDGGRKKREGWWNESLSQLKRIEISGKWMGVLVVLLAAVWMGWRGYGRAGDEGELTNGEDLNEEERLKMATELYRMGNHLFEMGKVDQAEMKFREATDMNPQHAFAWANLGNILRDRGDVDEAIRSHELAYQLVPTRARGAYNLAVSLQTAGRYSPAEATYQRAIELSAASTQAGFDVCRAYSNLGVTLQAQGKLAEAEGAYKSALEINPFHRSPGLNLCNLVLGMRGGSEAILCFEDLLTRDAEFDEAVVGAAGVLHLEGRLDEAVSYYRKALSMNPDNAGAIHGLASILGGDAVPDVAPAEYVRGMFNGYAVNFDESLAALHYQSPHLLRAAVDQAISKLGSELHTPPGQWRALDGGCGTGLAGPELRNLSAYLVGVDLSENMVEQARRRAVYDALQVGELSAGVEQSTPLDLFLLADVVVYIGNLSPLLHAAASALQQRRGLLALTTEKATGKECAEGKQGWLLTVSGRYAHCRGYLERAVAETGQLEVLWIEECVPRWNKGKPVPGLLLIARALPSPSPSTPPHPW